MYFSNSKRVGAGAQVMQGKLDCLWGGGVGGYQYRCWDRYWHTSAEERNKMLFRVFEDDPIGYLRVKMACTQEEIPNHFTLLGKLRAARLTQESGYAHRSLPETIKALGEQADLLDYYVIHQQEYAT